MGDKSLHLTGTNMEFSTLMYTLTREIGHRLHASSDTNIKTPWSPIFNVFLDSDGVAFKNSTRTQWQNALDDTLTACEKAVSICLDADGVKV